MEAVDHPASVVLHQHDPDACGAVLETRAGKVVCRHGAAGGRVLRHRGVTLGALVRDQATELRQVLEKRAEGLGPDAVAQLRRRLLEQLLLAPGLGDGGHGAVDKRFALRIERAAFVDHHARADRRRDDDDQRYRAEDIGEDIEKAAHGTLVTPSGHDLNEKSPRRLPARADGMPPMRIPQPINRWFACDRP
jgi:hypothetical protein